MKRKFFVNHFDIKRGWRGRVEVVFYDLNRKGKKWKREYEPSEPSMARLAALANSSQMSATISDDLDTIEVWRKNRRGGEDLA